MAQEPTTEERLLGAAAHLLLFMGLWVVGPLVLYFWHKERSTFVAFHAVQATLTALSTLVVASTLGIVYLVGIITTTLAFDRAGYRDYAGLAMLAFVLAVLVLAALPTLWGLYAAWKAFHGECWKIPILGRLARRLVPEPSDEQPSDEQPSAM